MESANAKKPQLGFNFSVSKPDQMTVVERIAADVRTPAASVLFDGATTVAEPMAQRKLAPNRPSCMGPFKFKSEAKIAKASPMAS